MAKHKNYVIRGSTLDTIAENVKSLLGVDASTPIRFDEITESTTQVNAEVETQIDLVAQIKTALNGKAGSSAAELGVLIDQSGVLESTDGTATEKVEQLIDKTENENIWYLTSEKLSSFAQFFYNSTFDKIPRMNPIKATTFSYAFNSMINLQRIDFYLNTESCKNFGSCFYACNSLEYVKGVNTAKATSVFDLFSRCWSLKTIEEPLDFSSATNTKGCFNECVALEDIRFVPECIKISIIIPSPVLSDESIQSIIDGLATVETAQTLTLHTDVKAKLTEEQLATITSKNWNLA